MHAIEHSSCLEETHECSGHLRVAGLCVADHSAVWTMHSVTLPSCIAAFSALQGSPIRILWFT
eukprot:987875-Amphidinium_carterae.1